MKQKRIVTDKINRSDLKTEIATTVEGTELESITHAEVLAKTLEKTVVVSRAELRQEKTEFIRLPVDRPLKDFRQDAEALPKSRTSPTLPYGVLVATIVLILTLITFWLSDMWGTSAQQVATLNPQQSAPVNGENQAASPETTNPDVSSPNADDAAETVVSKPGGPGQVIPSTDLDGKRTEGSAAESKSSQEQPKDPELQKDDTPGTKAMISSSESRAAKTVTRKKRRGVKRRKGKRLGVSSRQSDAPKVRTSRSLTTKEKIEIVRKCKRRVPCRKDILKQSARLKSMSIAELRAFPAGLDACARQCNRN